MKRVMDPINLPKKLKCSYKPNFTEAFENEYVKGSPHEMKHLERKANMLKELLLVLMKKRKAKIKRSWSILLMKHFSRL